MYIFIYLLYAFLIDNIKIPYFEFICSVNKIKNMICESKKKINKTRKQ